MPAYRTIASHWIVKSGISRLAGKDLTAFAGMARGRPPAAVAVRKWRAELIADLGGVDAVSTQQLAIVDLAGKQKLLLDRH